MISTDDLTKIAAAGGGLDLRNVVISGDDLVRITEAAARPGAKIMIRASRPVHELVRIAAAGKGCVTIYFD